MEILTLINKIAPELGDIIEKRYLILRCIFYNQPIGRRALANSLGFKERTVRDEIGILKEQGLLNIDFMGMYITDNGKKIIEELHEIYSDLKGIPQLEKSLEKFLKIKKVVVIPGNSQDEGIVLKDMGKITFKIVKENISPQDIIGITGGNTMAAVADEAIIDNKDREITVIPARGGLGKDVNTQSNSIAAKLGDKLGGSYRLLYVPDALEEEALEIMLKNKEIKESIDLIDSMNMLIFGIGRADTMAKRRNLPQEKIDNLLEDGAVAEAFGHYFDIDGKEVWEYKTVGLSLKKFKALDSVIGVAGGEEKAQAIMAITTLNKNMILVTDESAARKILGRVY